MLYEFIEHNRAEIRERACAIIVARGGASAGEELGAATDLFLEQIVQRLRADSVPGGMPVADDLAGTAERRGAARSSRAVTAIVYDYGAVCDAVSGLAEERREPIDPHEYRLLNLFIDEAVAGALEGYVREKDEASRRQLGVFSHELRNATSSAIFAFKAIQTGPMAIASHTGAVLERSLQRIGNLVEQSVAEVRTGRGFEPQLEPLRIADVFDELTAAAAADAAARQIPIEVHSDPEAVIHADRGLLLSAISNLLQNAIKFTRPGGRVWLRALAQHEGLRIEVEDRCGGLPVATADELFAPFVQKHADQSGLGLGLSIARRAVDAHGGRIDVRDVPGKGCVFGIELPRVGG